MRTDRRPALLWVDGDEEFVESMRGQYQQLHFIGVSTGAEAQAVMAQIRIDVLVSSETLPDGSGAMLLEQVRVEQPGVACILLSSPGLERNARTRAIPAASAVVARETAGEIAWLVELLASRSLARDQLPTWLRRPSREPAILPPGGEAASELHR